MIHPANIFKKICYVCSKKQSVIKSTSKFVSRVALPGSFRKLPAGKNMGNVSFNEVIEVMV